MSEDIFTKYDLVEKETIPKNIKLPESGIVLIVGSSGSGKSTIIRNTFEEAKVEFTSDRLVDDFSSHENAEKYLIACGLRSIPTWRRQYTTLSNGEAHRAFCAKCLDMGVEYIDEFTSVVDRNTAKSLSCSLKKWFDKSGKKRIVIATCHRDVMDWLTPDHVFDTDNREWVSRRLLRRERPSLDLSIYPCSVKDWVHFKKHHYLDSTIATACHCYVAIHNGTPVAFSAVIHGTGRDVVSYWRGSRLVVIPEFQGLGIGVAMSEAIAEIYLERDKRFYSKTAHPALGEYRNAHPEKWRATVTNGKDRPSYANDTRVRIGGLKRFSNNRERLERDAVRVCYSHEYIGSPERYEKAKKKAERANYNALNDFLEF